MNTTQKKLALAIGGSLALSIASTALHAAENPFAAKSLAAGYMVAENTAEKMKDGKCGAGKCGASTKAASEKAKEAAASKDKAKEAACGADKTKEGKCSADMKKDM
jgi:uncharacterized low-complexity protein